MSPVTSMALMKGQHWERDWGARKRARVGAVARGDTDWLWKMPAGTGAGRQARQTGGRRRANLTAQRETRRRGALAVFLWGLNEKIADQSFGVRTRRFLTSA